METPGPKEFGKRHKLKTARFRSAEILVRNADHVNEEESGRVQRLRMFSGSATTGEAATAAINSGRKKSEVIS